MLNNDNIEWGSEWILRDGKYPENSVRIVSTDTTRVAFARAGGGMVIRLPRQAFEDTHRQVTRQDLDAVEPYLAFFAFDSGCEVAGFTTGRRWNGWGLPLIPEDAMRAWVKRMKEDLGEEVPFTFVGDTLMCWYDDEGEEIETVELQTIEVGGRSYRVYEAGLGLCWNQTNVGYLSAYNQDALQAILDAVPFEGLDIRSVVEAASMQQKY